MNEKGKKDIGYTAILALLSAFASGVLVYDIYQVATGTVDMNKHWPFLLPTLLGVFIGIMVKIQRLTRDR